MAEIIRITEGLEQSYHIFKTYTIKNAIQLTRKLNKCYEVVRLPTDEDKLVRVYLDLDLNYDYYEGDLSNRTYEKLNTNYELRLLEFAKENNFILLTSSRNESKKISFRLFSKTECALYSNVANVALDQYEKIKMDDIHEEAKKEFDPYCPKDKVSYLKFDASVYKNGMKMRMYNSIKDKQQERPLILSNFYSEEDKANIKIEDTFILNVEGLNTLCPTRTRIITTKLTTKKSETKTPKGGSISESKNEDIINYPTTLPESFNIEALEDLINRLTCYNDYAEWNEVGFHLFTFDLEEYEPFDAFECFVKFSNKCPIKEKRDSKTKLREKWAGYKEKETARGWYGLRALLRKTEPEGWKEWSEKYEAVKLTFDEVFEELLKQEIPEVAYNYNDLLKLYISDRETSNKWTEDNIHESEVFKYYTKYHFYVANEKILYRIVDGGFELLEDIHSLHAILYSNGKHKTEFTRLFMKSIYKKHYTRMVFKLSNGKLASDEYNLFAGFKYDKPIACELIDNVPQDEGLHKYLEHINYLCCDDKQLVDYILNWMAHIVQKPEQKTKVCLYLYSKEEGVGKNIIFDIFGKVLSGYTSQFTNTEDIGGRFNTNMYNKLFIVGDEINGRASGLMAMIKDMITRLTENVEAKGKNKFQSPDYKNYGFTTNTNNAMPWASKRRVCAVHACEVKRTQEEYARLFQILDNDESLRAITYYLRNRDISRFLPSNIYMTEYLYELMATNICPSIAYFISEYALLLDDDNFEIPELYAMSKKWCKDNSKVSTDTIKQFEIDLKKYLDYYRINPETKEKGAKVKYSFKAKHTNPIEFYDKLITIIGEKIN